MIRPLTVLVLSVSFVAGALAQIPTPVPAREPIKTGDYAGRLSEHNGSRSADVKMTITYVGADGRMQGRVQSSHARKACAQRLPLNGMTTPDGDLRLTVDDGVPKGCERIYEVKLSNGVITGTFLDSVKPAAKKAKPQ